MKKAAKAFIFLLIIKLLLKKINMKFQLKTPKATMN